MGAASASLELILAVFSLIVIGYVAKHFKLLGSDDADILNKVIVYLLLPALVFQAVRHADFSLRLMILPAAAFAVGLLSLAAAYLIGRLLRIDRPILGGLMLTAAVGNTGYIGYPLTRLLFGEGDLVKAIFYDIFGTVVFIFTIGLFISEKYGAADGKIDKVREILIFPPLLALAAGFIMRPLVLPLFFTEAISFLAAGTIPLIMISIGLSLRLGAVRGLAAPLITAAFIKLAVSPAAVFAIGYFLNLDNVTFRILILEASMPTAMLTLILGLKYRLAADYIAAVIMITTAASLVTIPLWQRLAAVAIGT